MKPKWCKKTQRALWLLTLVMALLMTSAVHAYGAAGHRIVARIALVELTPRARLETSRLLDGGDLVSAATWMDEERTTLSRKIAKWHYVHRPVCGGVDDCEGGDCITARLPELIVSMSDPQREKALRANDLRMVIHMIGDLHQPLHVADFGDANGNGTTVEIEGRRHKLHSWWDSAAIQALLRGVSEEQLSEQLRGLPDKNPTLETARWATESFELGRKAYGGLDGFACGVNEEYFKADSRYAETAKAVIELQLARAGHRLAAVLNRAFAPR